MSCAVFLASEATHLSVRRSINSCLWYNAKHFWAGTEETRTVDAGGFAFSFWCKTEGGARLRAMALRKWPD